MMWGKEGHDIGAAVRLLQAGELVAFPTETVYGLGADAANPDAVTKIFAAKGRPADHPLIVHLPSTAYLDRWTREVPQIALDLAEAFWPGPLTLILKRNPAVPYVVTGNQETVGVRVPSHPLAQELLQAYAHAGGGRDGMSGLAGPSANRFGHISPTDAAHVREDLGTRVAMVLDGGPCEVGIESTIVDVSRDNQPPRILRPGHIGADAIAEVIEERAELLLLGAPGNAPRVSGNLKAHYAPRTPLRTVQSSVLAETIIQLRNDGQSVALLARTESATKSSCGSIRCLAENPREYAQGLYAALRELDQTGCDVIIVEAIPDAPGWEAITDRLRRAAYGSGSLQRLL